jgi:hypothetical protein
MAMRNVLLAVLLSIALVGCDKRPESVSSASAQMDTRAAAPRQYMAYQHSISLDVDEARVVTIYNTAIAACQQAVAEQCAILDSQVTTGQNVYATIKMRAKPEGIKRIIASLSSLGTVIQQSMTAEDLAKPIEDSKKKLEMLDDYRSKLESLRTRASTDVDALIKVNKELAEVQSAIEAETGTDSDLMQRVDTEVLNVSIASQTQRAFWRPISDAFTDFKSNLSDGISGVVTALAYIFPWGLTLLVLGWAGRKLWSALKRRPKT